ncbi:MAG: carbohydrate ABC transporter permease [Clostridia bacterium]|nr:carbohydrate ABC transporter permease [Clostridia bacterium]
MDKKRLFKPLFKSNGTVAEKIIYAVAFVILVLISALLIYPYIFAINSSLKMDDPDFLMHMSELSWPPRFSTYVEAFTDLTVGSTTYMGMFGNSVWYAAGRAIANVGSSMLLAYGVACYRFKLRNFIYNLVLFVLVMPMFGTLPATYRLYSDLGMIDSPLLLIAYAGAFDGQFLILYSFFKNLSWDYAESAFLDGAGHFTVFFKIMIPMALPATMTMAVTNFIAAWNDYSSILLYLPEMPTLTTGLYSFDVKQMYAADRPVYYAGLVISILPIFALFLGMQNTILAKTYSGGLKE